MENLNIESDFDFSESVQKEPMTAKESKVIEKQVLKEMHQTAKRLSPEEIAEKQKLILKIGRYEKSKHYGEQLKSLGFSFGKSLQSKSIDELKDQLVEMKVSLSSDPNSNMIYTGLTLATGFAEQLTQNPKIKEKVDLMGWTQNLKSNPEFEKVVELLSLEYESLSSLSPEARLMLIMCTSGITVAATNSHISQIRKMQQEAQKAKEQETPKEQEKTLSAKEYESVIVLPEPILENDVKTNVIVSIKDESESDDDDDDSDDDDDLYNVSDSELDTESQTKGKIRLKMKH